MGLGGALAEQRRVVRRNDNRVAAEALTEQSTCAGLEPSGAYRACVSLVPSADGTAPRLFCGKRHTRTSVGGEA